MIDEKQIKEWAEHECGKLHPMQAQHHDERRELAQMVVGYQERLDAVCKARDALALEVERLKVELEKARG